MVKMSVNRFCGDCMELGEFLPLKLVMININSGIWMCPKDECTFPMASPHLQDFMEENLNSDRVLLLSGSTTGQNVNNFQMNSKGLCKEKLDQLQNETAQTTSYIKSDKSNQISERKSFTRHSNGDHETASVITGVTETRSYCSTSDLPQHPTDKNWKGLPLWENRELLCWLDSIMSLLVLCDTLQQYKKKSGILKRLYKEYNSHVLHFQKTDKYQTVREDLETLRSTTLKFLHQKMMSNFTEDDSPLLSIQLLLKTSKMLYEDMEWDYNTHFKCTKCEFERKDSFRKIILDLPQPHADLNFDGNLYYERNCYRCSAPNQKQQYNIQRFPHALFLYFENGVGDRKFWKNLNFTSPNGDTYIVTQIVQYFTKRKHFVLWSYAYKEKLWIEVDDLKEPVVRPQYARPKCKRHDVHLVVLEKVSVLEKTTDRFKLNTHEGTPVESCTPSSFDVELNSPTLSGNSSIAVQVSGDTTRKTSLCSEDGVSPAGSIRNIKAVASSSNDLRGMIKDCDGKKSKTLHIPRYSPYMSKSKKLKEQLPAPIPPSTPTGKEDKTESTSGLQTDSFNEIFGNEINEFYNDMMVNEEAIDAILAQSHSENNNENDDNNNGNSNSVDKQTHSKNVEDNDENEFKIHFDIIPTEPTTNTEPNVIRITDDELEDILNGVY